MVNLGLGKVTGKQYTRQTKDKYLRTIRNYQSNYQLFLNHFLDCQIEPTVLYTKNSRNLTKLNDYPILLVAPNKQNISAYGNTSPKNSKKKFNVKSNTNTSNNLFCSVKFDLSKTLILQAGDVELNPGPEHKNEEIRILTYNARGLKDKLKLKRILNRCYNLIKENVNTFILFQETHLEDSERASLGLLWRHGLILSPSVGRQAGTLILYDESWVKIHSQTDDLGRLCLISVEKYELHLCLINVYAPNNHCSNFFTTLYEIITNHKINNPDASFIIGGDFNLVMETCDSINRGRNNSEVRSIKIIKDQNEILNLIDTYRVNSNTGGFTWSRGNCMSRLDMVFASKHLVDQGLKTSTNWGFDTSDHAMVEAVFIVKTDRRRGKGLFRLNAEILDNSLYLAEVRKEIDTQLATMPVTWNPHFKLDFAKMVIRSVIGLISGSVRKKEQSDHTANVNQLNLLKSIKEKLLIAGNTNDSIAIQIDSSIDFFGEEIRIHLEKLSKALIVRSGTKWYEEGERSNKYFLNLIKKRKNQTLINNLEHNGQIFTTQSEIEKHVVDFYQELYCEKETSDNFDDILSDLPKLNPEDVAQLDSPITLDELFKTLLSCKETAPGPDGIPYKVYKLLWPQIGHLLLGAWEYSVEKGLLPDDQRTSCITLIPKEGKNPDKIENWRPITLTNCDLKIFTKLYSERVAKKLDKLISPAQTAYIPGRVVHDNLRMFDFYSDYCKRNNVDALLISLDAKKAFDSVSHKYLEKVLKSYGFSDSFIEVVKLLYKDIKANIMINGYKSVAIKIARSVKQGDALSCALFILCIDPLIRKLENNEAIKPIPIPRSRYSNIHIKTQGRGLRG